MFTIFTNVFNLHDAHIVDTPIPTGKLFISDLSTSM